MVRQVNREAPPAVPAVPPEKVMLLRQIRDSVKSGK
jgi:large-conductance mechanosensitive channel